MVLDMERVNTFVGQFVADSGVVVIGEELGLYKALSECPLSSAELAAKTKTDER